MTMPRTMNFNKQEGFFAFLLPAILAFFSTYLWLGDADIWTIKDGLDPSWLNSLFTLNTSDQAWPHYIFTYGPTLNLLYFDPSNPLPIVGFYTLLHLNLYYLLKSKTDSKTLIVFFSLLVFSSLTDLNFNGFIYVFLLALSFGLTTKLIEIVVTSFLIAVFIYSKYSLGIALLASIVVSTLWFQVIVEKNFSLFLKKFACLSSICLVVFFYHFQTLNIFKFIGDHWDIIFAYSEAMSLTTTSPEIAIYFGFVIFFALTYLTLKAKQNVMSLVSIIGIITLFFAFKAGYTRADIHIWDFWTFAIFLSVLTIFLYIQYRDKFVGIGIFFAGIIAINALKFPPNIVKAPFSFTHYYNELVSPLGIFKRIKEHRTQNESFGRKYKRDFIRSNDTVDGFPIHLNPALYSGGIFHNRPIIQEYSAYSSHLEDRNYQAFVKNPPKWLIYDDLYHEIDERLPGMNAARLIHFINQNYRLSCDRIEEEFKYAELIPSPIFGAEPEESFVKVLSPEALAEKEKWVVLREMATLASGEIPAIKINIDRKLSASLKSIAYKPHEISLDIRVNNEIISHRIFRKGIKNWTVLTAFTSEDYLNAETISIRLREDGRGDFESTFKYKLGAITVSKDVPIYKPNNPNEILEDKESCKAL